MKQFLDERFRRSEMTASDVLDMRRLHDDEGLNDAQLSRIFDVHRKTVYNVVNRKTWKHIPDPVKPRGFSGYKVYPDGRVYSEALGEFISPIPRRSGNVYRLKTSGGKRRTVSADNLVRTNFTNRSSGKQ